MFVGGATAKQEGDEKKVPPEVSKHREKAEEQIKKDLSDPEFIKKSKLGKNTRFLHFKDIHNPKYQKRLKKEGIKKRENNLSVKDPSAVSGSSTSPTFTLSSSCTDVGGGYGLSPARDRIYYDPWGESTYVDVSDQVRIYLSNAEYIGMGDWVKLNNGDVISYTWYGYYDPYEELEWVLDDLYTEYGITEDEIEYVHIKYFIQSNNSYDFYHMEEGEWVWLGDKDIELWSEATYYMATGNWVMVGYPTEYGGGVNIINSNGYATTNAGYGMYTDYPDCAYRHFGYSSETGTIITIYSNPLHQYRISS